MTQRSRKICKYDFTIAAGSATTNVNLNPDDLSTAKALRMELYLSSIGTDSVDTLDVKLQTTRDGTTYNTRVRFAAVAGTTSAPRTYMATLFAETPLSGTEEVYEISGSSTTEITAGTVVNGPFPGRRRATGGGMAASWRLSFVQVDADSDATFVGTVTIWALSNYPG